MNGISIWNPSEWWLVWFVNVLFYVTTVSAIALCMGAVLRQSSVARHWIQLSALLLVLIAPLHVSVIQILGGGSLAIALLSEDRGTSQTAIANSDTTHRMHRPEVASLPESVAIPGIVDDSYSSIQGPAAVDAAKTVLEEGAESNASVSASLQTGIAEASLTPEHSQSGGSIGWLRSLVASSILVWLTGSTLLMLRLVAGLVRLRRVLRSAKRNTDQSLETLFLSTRCLFGETKRALVLKTSDRIEVPIAAGWMHPNIVLPDGLSASVTDRELREILVHETAHLERRDPVVVLVQNFVGACFWFHPLVHSLNRQVAQSREEICDNFVLHVSDAASYSRTLLAMAERLSDVRPLANAAGLFTSRWKLEQRVAGLLDPQRVRVTKLPRQSWLWVAAMTLITLALASQTTLRPVQANPLEPIAQTDQETAADEPGTQPVDPSAAKGQFVGRIRDAHGKPIGEAMVTLTLFTDDRRQVHRLIKAAGDDGSYAFSDLPIEPSEMRSYTLRSFAEGHAIECTSDKFRLLGKSQDEWPRVNDLTLNKAVSGQLRVVDQEGRPVEGATLRILSARRSLSNWWLLGAPDWESLGIPTPMSNSDGVLVIPAVDPTLRYNLELSHPDFAQTPRPKLELQAGPIDFVMEKGIEVRFEVTCDSDPKAVADATITALVSEEGNNQFLRLDLNESGFLVARLRDRPASIGIEHPTLAGFPWYFFRGSKDVMQFSLRRNGSVKGQVVDSEAGRGVSNVSVQFVAEGRVIRQVVTDEDGIYEAQVGEGPYTVSVSQNVPRWISTEQKMDVIVIASETLDVAKLVVKPRPSVHGQVVMATGEPVAEAIVVPNFRETPVLTDKDGRFTIQSRWGKNIPIQVFHPQHPLSRVLMTTGDSQELRIELAPESSVTGLVTDENDKPVSRLPIGLKVLVRTSRGSGGGISTTLRRHWTNNDGTFRYFGLTSGFHYQVTIDGMRRAERVRSNGVTSDRFELSNAPIDPIVLKVDSDLLAEGKGIARAQEFPFRILPLNTQRWQGDRIVDAEDFDGRFLFLAFGRTPEGLRECQLVHQVYGSQGMQVVGVLSQELDEQQMKELGGESIRFPITFDSKEANVYGRYGVSGSRFGLIYNARGELMRVIPSLDNALATARNVMLYGE